MDILAMKKVIDDLMAVLVACGFRVVWIVVLHPVVAGTPLVIPQDHSIDLTRFWLSYPHTCVRDHRLVTRAWRSTLLLLVLSAAFPHSLLVQSCPARSFPRTLPTRSAIYQSFENR